MLNKILRLIRREATVTSITAAFTKQVKELDALNTQKRAEASNCEAQIAKLHEQVKASTKEANKAAVIGARIEALIED